MKMHVLPGGRLRMRKSIYLPDADRSEMLELPVSAFLLRHRQGNVLFDSGCHPSAAENAEARWGGLAKVLNPIFTAQDTVVAALGRLGLAADDIDVVVCSHLHPDHCGCNAYFRKASFVCHAEELAAARAPDAVARGYLAAEWDQPMGFEEIAGEHDLFGDERIVLVPVPGHTPGTMAALVNLDRSGSFLLASDAVSLKVHLDRDFLPKNTWSAAPALASLQKIRRLQNAGVQVICGHDDAQWATLKQEADAYD